MHLQNTMYDEECHAAASCFAGLTNLFLVAHQRSLNEGGLHRGGHRAFLLLPQRVGETLQRGARDR